jgi:hypothetical protein
LFFFISSIFSIHESCGKKEKDDDEDDDKKNSIYNENPICGYE